MVFGWIPVCRNIVYRQRRVPGTVPRTPGTLPRAQHCKGVKGGGGGGLRTMCGGRGGAGGQPATPNQFSSRRKTHQNKSNESKESIAAPPPYSKDSEKGMAWNGYKRNGRANPWIPGKSGNSKVHFTIEMTMGFIKLPGNGVGNAYKRNGRANWGRNVISSLQIPYCTASRTPPRRRTASRPPPCRNRGWAAIVILIVPICRGGGGVLGGGLRL